MNNADWHHCGHSHVKIHHMRQWPVASAMCEETIYQCLSCGHRLSKRELPRDVNITGIIPPLPQTHITPTLEAADNTLKTPQQCIPLSCTHCHGTGLFDPSDDNSGECMWCEGSGKIVEEDEPPAPVTKEEMIASINRLLNAMNQLPNPTEDERAAMGMFMRAITLLRGYSSQDDL